MSWWETGAKRLVIGDAPADKVTGGLKDIAVARKQKGVAEPELAQLLSGLERVLKRSDGRLRHIFAKTSRGAVIASGRPDPALDVALSKIVRAVREAYMDELKRTATTEEVLACFLFVLGFEPERYLSRVDGLKIEEIEGEFEAA